MSHEAVKKTGTHQKKIDRSTIPPPPHDYVSLAAQAEPSRAYRCGAQLAKAISHGRDLPPEQIERFAFPCYDVASGSTVSITISFHGAGGKMHRPKGELRLKTDRGKLSATRFTLDGKHDKVAVQLTVPDETIKVSLRAFLDGFGRGKVHLHLQ